LQIITDDQAFDAVGDVAAGRGVRFDRLSYRKLVGTTAGASTASRRRRRTGPTRRRPRPRRAPASAPARRAGPAAGGGVFAASSGDGQPGGGAAMSGLGGHDGEVRAEGAPEGPGRDAREEARHAA